MNKLFTNIWKNRPMRWRIFFILLNTFFSILCAVITQNIIITIIFIIGSTLIDILVEIYIYIDIKKRISQLFKVKWYFKYSFFVFWALLPTICGAALGEIDILDNFASKLFANLVPNILGACVVCSIINHISKFGYEQIVYSLMLSKKDLLNIFIRLTYFGCFINAVNYDINDKLKYTNIINSIYLFIIIFCGAIAVLSFVLRIIDKQKFDRTAEEIYPSKTLFWGELFLISCGIGPIFFGIEKHEPILLIINSITAGLISIFLFVFIIHRSENESNTYPFRPVFWFIVFATINCIWNYCKWDKTGDILQQVFSGLGIFVFVGILLWRVYIKQKEESKKNNDYSRLKKEDLKSGMIVRLNNGFLYMVLLNADMETSEYNDNDILLGISADISVKQNCCLRLSDYNDDLKTDNEDFNVFEVYSTNRAVNIGQIRNYDSINRGEEIH